MTTITLNTIQEELINAFSNLMRGDNGFTLLIDTNYDEVYQVVGLEKPRPGQQLIHVAMDDDGVMGRITVDDPEFSHSCYGRMGVEAAVEVVEYIMMPFGNLMWGDYA